MSEALYEDTEVNWRVFLDRFDTEIYPVLFQERGYTKGEALIAWSIGRLEEIVDRLAQETE